MLLYFGDAKDNIFKHSLPKEQPLLAHRYFAHLQKKLLLKQLVFLHQVHGTDGVVLKTEQDLQRVQPFVTEGDFLITNLPGVGIGILVGDCLPVVAYDTKNKVVGIAHAGWQGAVAGVGVRMLERMQQQFGTRLVDVQVTFGPCAHVCCYEVQPDFRQHIASFAFCDKLFEKRGQKLFFDLPWFNRLQLIGIGIEDKSFCFDYTRCTLCDTSFFSHRRQGKKAGRNMTVVVLK